MEVQRALVRRRCVVVRVVSSSLYTRRAFEWEGGEAFGPKSQYSENFHTEHRLNIRLKTFNKIPLREALSVINQFRSHREEDGSVPYIPSSFSVH